MQLTRRIRDRGELSHDEIITGCTSDTLLYRGAFSALHPVQLALQVEAYELFDTSTTT
jgi:hypothetical protein